MNCPKCKSPIADDSQECEWCGFKIITKPKEKIDEIDEDEEAQIVNPQVENDLISETNVNDTSKSYVSYIFGISIVVIIIYIFFKQNSGTTAIDSSSYDGSKENVSGKNIDSTTIDSSSYYDKENGYRQREYPPEPAKK